VTAPSSQGPCICPPDGVKPGCPRCEFMWDWIGQDPFKSHIEEDAWFNGARPS
jgi:hypothetical protein